MIYKVPSNLSHSVVLWFYEFIMITDNRSFRNMSRKMRILFFFFNQSYLFVNGSSWVIWFLTSCFPLLSIHYSFPRIQTDLLISCVYLCQMLSKENKSLFSRLPTTLPLLMLLALLLCFAKLAICHAPDKKCSAAL